MTQMKNACGALLLWALCTLPALAACDWPEWDYFRQHYISEEGRVIDPADGRRITTSEGQSYGLFFALVNNDRETFARLLDWTERRLARGTEVLRWFEGEHHAGKGLRQFVDRHGSTTGRGIVDVDLFTPDTFQNDEMIEVPMQDGRPWNIGQIADLLSEALGVQAVATGGLQQVAGLGAIARNAGGETFVLEFLLEPFELHAADAFGTHECIRHDDTRQPFPRRNSDTRTIRLLIQVTAGDRTSETSPSTRRASKI